MLSLGAAIVCAAAEFEPWPEYTVGETARVDVATPIPLMVIDREGTDALRAREVKKIPAIFRFYTNAAAEAEASLRGAFGVTREEFMENLEMAYRQRKLTPQSCSKPRFAQFVNRFKGRNKVFPLTTNLAEIWATGKPDEPYLSEWVALLRKSMEQHIRVDPLPPEAKTGPVMMRMVEVQGSNTVLQLDKVETMTTFYARTNMISVFKARKDLMTNFIDEATVGKFLASFVKENCIFDAALTRQSRARVGESIWAADSYEAGQMLVKRGEVVSRKTKLALEQLRAKIAIENQRAHADTTAKAPVQAVVTPPAPAIWQKALEDRWAWTGAAALAAMALLVLWNRRKTQRARLLPVPRVSADMPIKFQEPTAVLSCPNCSEKFLVELPKPASSPALGREQSASVQPESHTALPLWLRKTLARVFRGLLVQRSLLLDTQRLAEMELRRLERRLSKMNAPLQERIAAYEKRIAELDKELAAQQEQNSELIKAQIELARRRLASVRQNVPKN